MYEGPVWVFLQWQSVAGDLESPKCSISAQDNSFFPFSNSSSSWSICGAFCMCVVPLSKWRESGAVQCFLKKFIVLLKHLTRYMLIKHSSSWTCIGPWFAANESWACLFSLSSFGPAPLLWYKLAILISSIRIALFKDCRQPYFTSVRRSRWATLLPSQDVDRRL